MQSFILSFWEETKWSDMTCKSYSNEQGMKMKACAAPNNLLCPGKKSMWMYKCRGQKNILLEGLLVLNDKKLHSRIQQWQKGLAERIWKAWKIDLSFSFKWLRIITFKTFSLICLNIYNYWSSVPDSPCAKASFYCQFLEHLGTENYREFQEQIKLVMLNVSLVAREKNRVKTCTWFTKNIKQN